MVVRWPPRLDGDSSSRWDCGLMDMIRGLDPRDVGSIPSNPIMDFEPIPYISAPTIASAWPKALATIVAHGSLVGSVIDQRGDEIYEILGLSVRITDPLKGMIPKLPKRVGVTAWGDRDRLDEYFENEIFDIDPKGFDYIYGQWLVPGLFDALKVLENDPSTRRAYIPVGNLNDAIRSNPACLRGVHLIVRDGRLHQLEVFRSHDYAGAAATNWYGLIKFQELAANELGLEVGEHRCYSESAHIRIGKANNPNDHGDLYWVEGMLR